MAAQPAHCAVVLIGAHDALPELALMHALSKRTSYVSTANLRFGFVVLVRGPQSSEAALLNTDRKRKASRVISDNEHGPFRDVESRDDAVKVNQGRLSSHSQPQADVIAVSWVLATISVAEQAVGPKRIIVWRRFAFDDGDRSDAEGHLGQYARLKDALGADHRHTLTVVNEPFPKGCIPQDAGVSCTAELILKDAKRRESNLLVDSVHWGIRGASSS